MDKKYQVFISSTYTDMKAERQAAVEAILDAGHIPAGMELFAASDKEQMEVIKGWIDESDIFMLVLGGRYGSVESESGKSYIQLEYEHAVATNKPFFALYLTDKAIAEKAKGPLGLDATERHDTKALNEFRATVKNKLCSEIEDVKDIKIQVPKSIRNLGEKRKLGGWVRSSAVLDVSPLMSELAALRGENDALKAELTRAKTGGGETDGTTLSAANGTFSKSALDSVLELHLTCKTVRGSRLQERTVTWTNSYIHVFSLLAAKLLEEPSDSNVRGYLRHLLQTELAEASVEVDERDFQSMKLKLVALGVISLQKASSHLLWILTANGKALMMKMHSTP
ncbi:uncharacterized protein DUF4062 [Paraburkholderia sp. BL6669N2]|uniref:DUF4062 domain-containing protein n=1 Tax=Paraburkholderia sp. BL6669N2 TaxID=1938807 RepID=UPI000E251C8E|nr:DUF4062 domain-containing protein [Paraburkholderia sp. BL6669N2]REG57619.1 uncharacterized protein DUF4062 [Paraburkholderia sp. BL6669N2]